MAAVMFSCCRRLKCLHISVFWDKFFFSRSADQMKTHWVKIKSLWKTKYVYRTNKFRINWSYKIKVDSRLLGILSLNEQTKKNLKKQCSRFYWICRILSMSNTRIRNIYEWREKKMLISLKLSAIRINISI